MDAIGRQILLKAWIAVLEGRREDVPLLLDLDPFNSIPEGHETQQYIYHDSMIRGFQRLFFYASYFFELAFYPRKATHIVCLPGTWVERLRTQAIQDIRSNHPRDPSLFVSHGDVILAWLAKSSVIAQNFNARRPVAVTNVFNSRGIFDDDLPVNSAFIGNAALPATTFTTVSKLWGLSVGEFALLRRDLLEQKNAGKAGSYITLQKQSTEDTGRGAIFGHWNQVMIGLNNWHKARFFDIEFAAAVVCEGIPLHQQANRLGQPSLVVRAIHAYGLDLRNIGALKGKDAAGNWWLTWTMRVGAWEKFEELLQCADLDKPESVLV